MPRDLDLERLAQSQDLSLTPEASMGTHTENTTPGEFDDYDDEEYEEGPEDVMEDIDVVGESAEMLRELHPYAQVLGLADVDSLVELENAAFPEEHRITREKVWHACGTLL